METKQFKLNIQAIVIILIWLICWGSYFLMILFRKDWIIKNPIIAITWFYGTLPLIFGLCALFYFYNIMKKELNNKAIIKKL